MSRDFLVLAAGLAFAACTGTVQAQSSASLYTSATRYDAMGRVTGTIAPSASNYGQGYSGHLATRTTYDAAGRPIKIESGYLSSWQSEAVAPASWPGFTILKTIQTTYNAQSQKLTERVIGSDLGAYSLNQYSYDSSGRLECTAVRMNPAIYGSLPSSACTLGTQGSGGPDRITRNVYDVAGQLVQVREGVGTSIEAAEVTYTYTNNGKIEFVIDANGHKAEQRYDSFDRQWRWVFPSTTNPSAFSDSTPANAVATAGALNESDYEQYGYDSNSNRTSLRKRDGSTLTYTYDALNRMTYKYVPGSTTHTRDVYYTYDLRGLMTSARFDSTSGEGIVIGYDGFGRKTSETLSMDGATRTLTSQYDQNSNRISLTYPDSNYVYQYFDGLDRPYYSHISGAALVYTPFDQVGRLAAVYRWNSSAATWVEATGYSYDNISRVSAFWHSVAGTTYDSTWSFGRNPASQITTQTRTNDLYAWNGATTVNRSYTANGLNQYSAVAGTSFSYDANGNLTSDGSNTFGYDVENRLVTRSGGASATLRFDPLGRLYESTGSSGTRRFLHDGDALVAEYNTAGTLLRRYVHGTDAGDDPLVWFEGGGVADSARRYLYADERGSIVAVTDANGNVTSLNTYDEYGIPGAGNTGAFQYTGQVWLPELGMYYYKARMYSPTLGRFMQTDPIGYEDQFNLYGYVGNDPVNSRDYTGLATGSLFSSKGCNDGASSCHVAIGRDLHRGLVPTVGTRLAQVAATAAADGPQPGPADVVAVGVAVLTVAEAIDRYTEGKTKERTATSEDLRKGIIVFRLWGGGSGPNGRSWTPVDPRTMDNPRDTLGLPNGNIARRLRTGVLIDQTGVEFRSALPLDGNAGGGPEIFVPSPIRQVKIISDEPFQEPRRP